MFKTLQMWIHIATIIVSLLSYSAWRLYAPAQCETYFEKLKGTLQKIKSSASDVTPTALALES